MLAVATGDAGYLRSDLDRDAVAVSSVKVVLLHLPARGPHIAEENVKSPGDVALAGVVLTKQHEGALVGEPARSLARPPSAGSSRSGC